MAVLRNFFSVGKMSENEPEEIAQSQQSDFDRIGVCQAIISGISTKVDGSILLKLEINPGNQEIISKLFQRWAVNKRLINIGMVGVDDDA